ncbi:MAG: hypothetical protein OZ934_03220 [Anaerolineae bacterium]|nr:hypothetical protein [Anaerolineae bacterium]
MNDMLQNLPSAGQMFKLIFFLILALIVIGLVLAIIKALIPLLIVVALIGGGIYLLRRLQVQGSAS